MKRAATATKRRPKKLKVSQKPVCQQQSQLQSQSIMDAINAVASQADIPNTPLGFDGVSYTDELELLGDSLARDAATACKNLHAEITKLTAVIQLQQRTIGSIELKLNAVLSILQKSTNVSIGQPKSTSDAGKSASNPSAAATAATATSGHLQPSTGGAGHSGRVGGQPQRRGADQPDDNMDFTLIIHRTLNDVTRRKRNVVISGLEEEAASGRSDLETFEEFCEFHLPYKPSLAGGNNNCRRIGKSVNGKPRRLLVKLSSDEAAATLLDVAPSLRHSTDEYVSKNVFINADLSPSAAKLAFEARKKRRDQQNRHPAAVVPAVSQSNPSIDSGTSPSTSGVRSNGPVGATEIACLSAASTAAVWTVSAAPAISSTAPPSAAASYSLAVCPVLPSATPAVTPTPVVAGFTVAPSFPSIGSQVAAGQFNVAGQQSPNVPGYNPNASTFFPTSGPIGSYWPTQSYTSFTQPPPFQQLFPTSTGASPVVLSTGPVMLPAGSSQLIPAGM